MSEEKNIEEQPEDNISPTTGDNKISAEGNSISSEENEIVPNVEPQSHIIIIMAVNCFDTEASSKISDVCKGIFCANSR
jgi:hypothetical protein